MMLSPRYDGLPIISLDGDAFDVLVPLLRQRRRLEALLGALTPEQWAHPTRCERWSVQDVITHLVDTNAFWAFSISSGVAGNPTRFLATFDPVASPAQLVEAKRDLSCEEVLSRFVASNQALDDALSPLDAAGWNALAEAPPGHLSVRAVAHHALWDGWVHERDIALPQGLSTVEEPDEVLACLRYVAALSPAFALTRDGGRSGTMVITATHPQATVTVTVGDDVHVSSTAAEVSTRLQGRAVDLVEMLSTRMPLEVTVEPGELWFFEGLATVFDTEVDLATTD